MKKLIIAFLLPLMLLACEVEPVESPQSTTRGAVNDSTNNGGISLTITVDTAWKDTIYYTW